VLFLDEMLEFHRGVLEVLRQPLEEGHVTVARAARTVTFPARFVLVGAMNPCPCGFAGDPVHDCRCTPPQVAKYRGSHLGTAADRLDLTVEVPAVSPDILGGGESGEPSAAVRARVVEARSRQCERTGAQCVRTNSALTPQMMATYCRLDSGGLRILAALCSDWV